MKLLLKVGGDAGRGHALDVAGPRAESQAVQYVKSLLAVCQGRRAQLRRSGAGTEDQSGQCRRRRDEAHAPYTNVRTRAFTSFDGGGARAGYAGDRRRDGPTTRPWPPNCFLTVSRPFPGASREPRVPGRVGRAPRSGVGSFVRLDVEAVSLGRSRAPPRVRMAP